MSWSMKGQQHTLLLTGVLKDEKVKKKTGHYLDLFKNCLVLISGELDTIGRSLITGQQVLYVAMKRTLFTLCSKSGKSVKVSLTEVNIIRHFHQIVQLKNIQYCEKLKASHAHLHGHTYHHKELMYICIEMPVLHYSCITFLHYSCCVLFTRIKTFFFFFLRV